MIASYEADPLRSADDLTPSNAVVVAHGVLVLSTSAASTTDGAAALGVTLLVTPNEARRLVFASTHGVITLALVPPESARR